MQITICPPAKAHDWEPYDAHQHYRTHHRTSAQAGLDYVEYSNRCHTLCTKQAHGLRDPAPWAMCDETLRETLLVFLERRFNVRPATGDDTDARLARIEAAAKKQEAPTAARLQKYVRTYNERNGATVGLHLQNEDTSLLLTQRGHAKLVAALVYLYFRLGFTSADCADALGLKPPHVRQILARMAHTWKRFVATDAPDRGLPVLRGHAARARLASRTRIRAGVGEMYSVRRRLKKISTPLGFPHAGKPAGERNGQR